jgi:hypothetical protein
VYRMMRDVQRCAFTKRVVSPNLQDIADSIAAIDACSANTGKPEADNDAPIFVLGCGWRTGSTLLQRILVTDPGVLLWGEPLGDLGLLSNIAQMLAQVPSFRKLNRCALVGKPAASSLAVSWIANLSPPGEDFRCALRTLVDNWLGRPALERGFARWGFKEVRLGAAEAMILHWLYPRAKFLLLTRHPYDCYRSLSDAGWDQVYHQRPGVQVDSAVEFARHWNRLAVSWSELPPDFPALHIKYEEIINGIFDFRALEKWLGVRITEDVALSVIVGRTSSRLQLGWHERWIIAREARAGMQHFGYA